MLIKLIRVSSFINRNFSDNKNGALDCKNLRRSRNFENMKLAA